MLDRLTVHMNEVPVYDISYHDSFDELKDLLTGFNTMDRKVCVVSDSKVASFYMDAILRVIEPVCKKVTSYVFPEGEPSKNLNVVRELYEHLILEKFDRHDLLIALGGGVVGDLTGFSAATYLRGIDFIQVPTSLLSQVDSSIGGKTGVDFDSYKNMVGAFYMPKHVFMNLNVLYTLDRRQFFSGMGEIVKSALIKDYEFFNWLIDNNQDISKLDLATLNSMVYKCNIVKKNVVEKDPTEKGDRALLNFGHTIGHALEKYMNFEMLHGECVSIGCILSTIISYNKGYISVEDKNRIIELIKTYELPLLPQDIDVDEIIKYTKNDKKVVGNSIKFILLREIGDAFITTEVTDEDMKLAINEYLGK